MRVVPFCFFALLVSCTQVEPQRDDVRKHIEQKIAKSQQAWAVEDVDAIIRHEHSNIHKLMAVDNVIIGKEASRADLEVALKSYKFSLKNYEIENFDLLIFGVFQQYCPKKAAEISGHSSLLFLCYGFCLDNLAKR